MNKNEKKPLVVSFGEVLWDIFPDYRVIGGAPLNVAYHLPKFGLEAKMITCIGNDELGEKALEALKEMNISTEQTQIDQVNGTGYVLATFDEHNEAKYVFKEDSAWDFIKLKQEDIDLVAKSDAFVFGTLASRNQMSKNTLLSLLEAAKYKVCDVNFRPPHYDIKFVADLLHKSDLVKMNKAELREILSHIGKEYIDEEDSVKYLQEHFNLDEIIVSKGSKGGIYHQKDKFHRFPAVKITIKDTVGSGDSFLSGFLVGKLKGKPINQIINQASSLGAFITSKAGACPKYTTEEFITFCDKNVFNEEEITIQTL